MYRGSIAFLIALQLLVFPFEAYAERLYTSGFEWQSGTAGVEFSGTSDTGPAISTSIKHSGAASGLIGGGINHNAGEGIAQTVPLSNTLYARSYIYIDDMVDAFDEATGFYALAVYNATTELVASVKIENNAGTLTMRPFYNDGGAELTDTASLSFDTWYRIEMFVDTTGGGATDTFTVRVDGTQVAHATNLNFTSVDPVSLEIYHLNTTGVADNTTAIYVDDIAFNDTSGSNQTSWPGAGNIAIVVPNAAGDNNCATGDYSMINEIPPSDTVSAGSTVCEITTSDDEAYFNVTDASTAGIDSYDTITLIQPMARMREEITTGAPSGYSLRLKSASGGTATSTPGYDASNATTVRTNPNGNTEALSFLNRFVVYTDPTTGIAWTPTGTNSIDAMQIGVASTDSDPDFYVVTYAAFIEYVDGVAPVINPLMRALGQFRWGDGLRLLGL